MKGEPGTWESGKPLEESLNRGLKQLRLGFLGAFGLFTLAFLTTQLLLYLWGGVLGLPGVYRAGGGGMTAGAWLVALLLPGYVGYRVLRGQDRRNINILTRLWDSWRWFDHGVEMIGTEEEYGQRQEESFARASALDPDDPYARNNLGTVLMQQGRIDEAIGLFREAIRKRPDYFKPYANLGAAWARKGKTDKAIDLYAKALELNPRDAATHLNMGLALARCGRKRQAASHLRQFITLAPHHPRREEISRFVATL
jgi:tetratricopeptide (TPR) repeat protein